MKQYDGAVLLGLILLIAALVFCLNKIFKSEEINYSKKYFRYLAKKVLPGKKIDCYVNNLYDRFFIAWKMTDEKDYFNPAGIPRGLKFKRINGYHVLYHFRKSEKKKSSFEYEQKSFNKIYAHEYLDKMLRKHCPTYTVSDLYSYTHWRAGSLWELFVHPSDRYSVKDFRAGDHIDIEKKIYEYEKTLKETAGQTYRPITTFVVCLIIAYIILFGLFRIPLLSEEEVHSLVKPVPFLADYLRTFDSWLLSLKTAARSNSVFIDDAFLAPLPWVVPVSIILTAVFCLIKAIYRRFASKSS